MSINIKITEKAIQKLNSGEKVNLVELPAGVTHEQFKTVLKDIENKLNKNIVVI
jgi:hypothetical protein